ncbi:MAG: 3-hydroxyacyl-[acyl-carrier-protein] dehydratase FabZ [Tenericutes bacterium GWC2_34_14]|nr:MAG: 3-hydroxyacyl-[acyl-carrier-protein] dehydratase FabZ [Tenericutes bacterium GWA2_35_7]OHE28282.1 MAG: 3-hydroxyacyl-[acyl-carrier-protein] dehydratase FabZ [Tenericutes bacterium GWC2_34_14]OHE33091.1 MAG: 3-hydroxyacyl-[acyl-carrier-protein] dehydratase FabZ [Tenericutes bacterium GWE2_34_108]OHE36211.1 MAG: 3-hydroxyacyl-[acyl-carrier-protein] dehydratase FabZ [Tenericutes bacterium GWF1_35_14]OHE38746.1 MAG: 3-hydroxyacyl-[acyl-carrier-protein] dehydratase FabZ [Tenericutes bacteriu
MRLTQDEIKAIIPHRDPFLFIDEMIELESLHKGVGIKYVKPEEPFFQGHFPGKPVMPGVLIIESLAQVGAVILLSHPDYAGKIAYFTGISNAKFRKSVLPGDMLELHCELTKIRRGFGFGTAKAFVNGELACETDISFAVGN